MENVLACHGRRTRMPWMPTRMPWIPHSHAMENALAWHGSTPGAAASVGPPSGIVGRAATAASAGRPVEREGMHSVCRSAQAAQSSNSSWCTTPVH
eukprot:365975-Chlamydomonas_euryale.AAC.10